MGSFPHENIPKKSVVVLCCFFDVGGGKLSQIGEKRAVNKKKRAENAENPNWRWDQVRTSGTEIPEPVRQSGVLSGFG